MVKASLVKGSTTRAIGKRIAAWIRKANCGVIVLINGVETAVFVFESLSGLEISTYDNLGDSVPMKKCRIHRDTVKQIRAMIGI